MAAATPSRFKNEIGPLGAKCVHKIAGPPNGEDFVRALSPWGAFLVLKARVRLGEGGER
jgi:hypothetical protein